MILQKTRTMKVQPKSCQCLVKISKTCLNQPYNDVILTDDKTENQLQLKGAHIMQNNVGVDMYSDTSYEHLELNIIILIVVYKV